MPREKHHKKASSKQITALTLINQGMSKRQAMLKAGYAPSVANTPKVLMESQAVTSILDQFHLQLKDEGLTTTYLAKKFMEWVDAGTYVFDKQGNLMIDPTTKEAIRINDYKTQIKAGEMLKQTYGLDPTQHKAKDEGLTRRVTLEEFVSNLPAPSEPLPEVSTIVEEGQ